MRKPKAVTATLLLGTAVSIGSTIAAGAASAETTPSGRDYSIQGIYEARQYPPTNAGLTSCRYDASVIQDGSTGAWCEYHGFHDYTKDHWALMVNEGTG
ncbi:hypothetical protein [Actinomadura miaoliensis]|uniref:Uncharacterized protein n=1 Tax=Actinomadura miaoliensis TaxID=430685 RepID=A0ABP7WLI3_9ACTN